MSCTMLFLFVGFYRTQHSHDAHSVPDAWLWRLSRSYSVYGRPRLHSKELLRGWRTSQCQRLKRAWKKDSWRIVSREIARSDHRRRKEKDRSRVSIQGAQWCQRSPSQSQRGFSKKKSSWQTNGKIHPTGTWRWWKRAASYGLHQLVKLIIVFVICCSRFINHL